MITIGLTGRSGSGKGCVCIEFEKHGIPSLDTDAVSRIVYEPSQACYDEIVAYFGKEILLENGTIHRKKLFNVAFSSEEKYKALNSIAHRHILDYCRKWLAEKEMMGANAAVIDAPMLFESGFDSECDLTIAVISTDEMRIKRLKERDGIDAENAKKRLTKQKSDEYYIEKCDFSIYNDRDGLDNLSNSINEIINILKEHEKWKTLKP